MTRPFVTVRPVRVHHDVGRQIARSIVAGDFAPGDSIPSEAVLIEQFGVSRAVVREALRDLQQRGLVEMSQGKRTVVSDESNWDVLDPMMLAIFRDEGRIRPLVRDFLWIRLRLEPEIAAEAARQADDVLLDDLERLLDRMEQVRHDPASFFEVDMEFHNRLAAAVDNRVLRRLMTTIGHLFYVSRDLTLDSHHAPTGALAWHLKIHEALRNRDPDAAREAMDGHLAWTRDRILPRLADLDVSPLREPVAPRAD